MTPDRVLIVEDEAIVALDVSRRLTQMGYEVTGMAASGQEALALVAANSPDLVLMDIRLIGPMDGIETANLTRERFDLPVIFLTAHADTNTLERAKASQPYGYIIKPVETAQLSTSIAIALYKHRMEKQLRASEARFRQLAEVNPAAILVFSLHAPYPIRFANPAFLALTGLSAPPADLAALQSTSPVMPEDGAALRAALDALARNHETRTELTMWIAPPDAERRLFTITLVSTTYDDEPACMLVGTDITHQHRAEQERLELALERERRQMLQSIMDEFSHDFRNPLAVIRSSLYLLNHSNNGEKRAHYRTMIERQVLHLEAMLKDILAIAHLENKPTLELTEVSLRALLDEVIQSQAEAAHAKNHTLRLNACPPETTLRADHTQLFRALTNILANAVRYTPPGGTITVEARQVAHRAVIEIADNGIGISESDLPHIFDRFYRAPQAKQMSAEGTGLGLAITHKIVQFHGGALTVSSQEGEGTTFTISLPLASASHQPLLAAQAEAKPTSANGHRQQATELQSD
ncbi:MAG: hypothetical protein Kow0077_32370 [Anaerolineae bacterium]